MPINKEKNLLFVHIPKTGGSTLERLVKEQTNTGWEYWGELKNLPAHHEIINKYGYIIPNLDNTDGSNQKFLQHLTLEHFYGILPEEEFSNYKKVSVIRNPWDRLVSFYEYNLQTRGRMGTKGKSFKEWFYSRKISPTLLPYLTVKGEVPSSLELIRFDDYKNSLRDLFHNLSIDYDDKVNEKKTIRQHYRNYYTSRMVDELARECEKDISKFNFNF
ncbi:MAG: sulfotransferase family 2 domain-containing protein [Pseudomonadota bacterium]|nr:sulfotransferase family 2 domain-containing protein [Pseudomonadota bacterium]